jgi:hypothetical protein
MRGSRGEALNCDSKPLGSLPLWLPAIVRCFVGDAGASLPSLVPFNDAGLVGVAVPGSLAAADVRVWKLENLLAVKLL